MTPSTDLCRAERHSQFAALMHNLMSGVQTTSGAGATRPTVHAPTVESQHRDPTHGLRHQQSRLQPTRPVAP